MPGEGPISNANPDLLTEWNEKSKELPETLEQVLTPEVCEELFETLADWNTYLEKDVPYFQEVQP